MQRVLIYIAGPISKGEMLHNVQQADIAFFALLKAGIPAICPHWSVFSGSARTGLVPVNPRIDPAKDQTYTIGVIAEANALPRNTVAEDWYGMDLEIVRRCDAVLRLPGESVGADREVALARELDKPVFRTIEEVIAWAEWQE